VKIGEDCMFSHNIVIWPQDWHKIITGNGDRINYGSDIEIMDHVWVRATAFTFLQ
jgi:acetyltransferase-like isoleucine patch superfamily enzyme